MSKQNGAQNASKPSDKITLQRGKRKVTYEKVPDQFAVRYNREQVSSAAEKESTLGVAKANVEQIGTDREEALDVYTIKETSELEATVDKLREEPTTDIVTHVYRLDDSAGGAMIPVGTLTVQFKKGVPPDKQKEMLAAFGLEIVKPLDYLPNGYTVQLTAAATENPLKIANRLQQQPEIETAEPDMSFQIELQYTPNDPLYPEQWHLRNRGDRLGLVADADVKAEKAWDITRGERQITLCVMDDGFDLSHPDFDVPGKIVAPRDLLQDDLNPAPLFGDDNHGTACAGVAVAEQNGIGVVGMAPGCAFMPVRMALSLSDNAVETLFKHAIDKRADVISCSWSAKALDFPLSTKINAIIHYAATQGRANSKGCVILFAAGNENRPLDGVMPDGRYSHQGFALHPDVIAVGASNSQDQRSAYSNFGPELTICAPSSGSPGRCIVTTDRRGAEGYVHGNYTFTFGGTSSATPLAAGLAALILSVKGDLTAAEVKQMMMETADKIDVDHGNYIDGHSRWYGYGRINAFAAVKKAKSLKDEAPPTEAEQEVHLEVRDVSLFISGSAETERMLLAQTQFRIAGASAETLAADQIGFRHDVEITHLQQNKTEIVASGEDQLLPQQMAYTCQQLFPLPEIGRYTLRSIITLKRPSGPVSAAGNGPTFRVTP